MCTLFRGDNRRKTIHWRLQYKVMIFKCPSYLLVDVVSLNFNFHFIVAILCSALVLKSPNWAENGSFLSLCNKNRSRICTGQTKLFEIYYLYFFELLELTILSDILWPKNQCWPILWTLKLDQLPRKCWEKKSTLFDVLHWYCSIGWDWQESGCLTSGIEKVFQSRVEVGNGAWEI